MDANAFRHFYEYHFAENRKIWDTCIVPLSQEQFIQNDNYSHGSVRNQIIHLISVDNGWFSDLGADGIPDPADLEDRTIIRTQWDNLEQGMRDYLAKLQDDMLSEKPLSGEDKDLILWQVLLHVANHGTDHRAQLLRVLSDLGVKTDAQDYVFYLYEHPNA